MAIENSTEEEFTFSNYCKQENQKYLYNFIILFWDSGGKVLLLLIFLNILHWNPAPQEYFIKYFKKTRIICGIEKMI